MKQTKVKRAFILCVVLTMVLSAFSINASAADADDGYRLLFAYNDSGEYDEVDGTYTVIGYEGTLPQELYIPPEYNGCIVNAVGDGAFAHCDTLRSLNSFAQLSSIGQGAFAECDNLESVWLSGACIDFRVECYAFQNCKKLKSFSTANGSGSWRTQIMDGAFMGCSALETVNIYAAWVHDNAFLGCASLKTVQYRGYKPDCHYDNPDEMVSDIGNASFLRADWIWTYYPAQDVERSYVTVNYQSGKEYTYTVQTPIEEGQQVTWRLADNSPAMLWVDQEGQTPGTVMLHAYANENSDASIVFLILDKSGEVLCEEYVTIHVTISVKQLAKNYLDRMKYADSLLECFRVTVEYLYQLVTYVLHIF